MGRRWAKTFKVWNGQKLSNKNLKCNWALRHFLLGFSRFFKSRKLINVCCHVGWWSWHFKYQQMLNFCFICQQSCTRYLNCFVILVDTCVRSTAFQFKSKWTIENVYRLYYDLWLTNNYNNFLISLFVSSECDTDVSKLKV
jgi:hypothetical protein